MNSDGKSFRFAKAQRTLNAILKYISHKQGTCLDMKKYHEYKNMDDATQVTFAGVAAMSYGRQSFVRINDVID